MMSGKRGSSSSSNSSPNSVRKEDSAVKKHITSDSAGAATVSVNTNNSAHSSISTAPALSIDLSAALNVLNEKSSALNTAIEKAIDDANPKEISPQTRSDIYGQMHNIAALTQNLKMSLFEVLTVAKSVMTRLQDDIATANIRIEEYRDNIKKQHDITSQRTKRDIAQQALILELQQRVADLTAKTAELESVKKINSELSAKYSELEKQHKQPEEYCENYASAQESLNNAQGWITNLTAQINGLQQQVAWLMQQAQQKHQETEHIKAVARDTINRQQQEILALRQEISALKAQRDAAASIQLLPPLPPSPSRLFTNMQGTPSPLRFMQATSQMQVVHMQNSSSSSSAAMEMRTGDLEGQQDPQTPTAKQRSGSLSFLFDSPGTMQALDSIFQAQSSENAAVVQQFLETTPEHNHQVQNNVGAGSAGSNNVPSKGYKRNLNSQPHYE